MWVVYVFIGYWILAIAGPAVWASWPTWRRARIARRVTCPGNSGPALVSLDPWYAVRMHAVGNDELRVKNCGRWPEARKCGRECLEQIGAAT